MNYRELFHQKGEKVEPPEMRTKLIWAIFTRLCLPSIIK